MPRRRRRIIAPGSACPCTSSTRSARYRRTAAASWFATRTTASSCGWTASFAFGRLFGSDAVLAQALTAALTLYIAFYAIGLLTGRTSLSVSALTPRMMTLGIALTFATSWVAYQSVIWNLLVGAPD